MIRQFALIFGVGLVSGAVVIGIFLFGLCVGSFLGGKLAEKHYPHNPRLRTSEAVYLDKNGFIRYQGAIDNGLDYEISAGSTLEYLTDAVRSVVVGKNPKVPKTEAKGCLLN